GGQIAWMLYNVTPLTGGSSFLTLANAVTETAGLNGTFVAIPNTGLSYASFLIGQIDRGSLTQNVVQEYGSRFRAISPYVQDNWKVTPKLTLDLGVRYEDRKSTRLNSSHRTISYAVFCLKKKILIGINLLREGLDLPEVSLVANLDADKEGFLLSAGLLIQTMGRCARNLNGSAMFYADKI